MIAAAVVSTGMIAVIVVVAAYIGIEVERAAEERIHGAVCVAAYPTVQADSCFGQSDLCAAADAAANQRVHAVSGQKTGQRAVAAAIGGHNFTLADLSIRHVIQLELLCVSKMLENLTIFVGDSNFHRKGLLLHASMRCRKKLNPKGSRILL